MYSAFIHAPNAEETRNEKTIAIELYSPEGLEATLSLSSHAPNVQILSPQNGSNIEPVDGKANVTWLAADADRDSLKYAVLYSSDGENWQERAFEIPETSAQIALDDAPDHWVKVIATDGARSGSATVAFSTRAKPPQPSAQPASASGLDLLSNLSIDLSFLPPQLAELLGNGFVELKIGDGTGVRSFWFSLEGGKMVSAEPPVKSAPAAAVAMRRSVFDAIANSVDPQNAAKLAAKNGAAPVAFADGLKQAAFDGAKNALDAKEFSPAPDTPVVFHGRSAVVVAGPGGRPSLSIPNERYLPVMNGYGAPLGATTREAIAQTAKAGLGFSKDAGIVAADVATGRPLLEPTSTTLAAFLAAGSTETPAKAAYYGATGAKKAYENARKKA